MDGLEQALARILRALRVGLKRELARLLTDD
jgi:hypothetical protein